MKNHDERLKAAARIMYRRTVSGTHWDNLDPGEEHQYIETMKRCLTAYGEDNIRYAAKALQQHMDAIFDSVDGDEMTVKDWRTKFAELSRELLRMVPR